MFTEIITFQIFHCVHFECPAQDAISKSALELEFGKGAGPSGELQTQDGASSSSSSSQQVEYRQIRRPMTANQLKRFTAKSQPSVEAGVAAAAAAVSDEAEDTDEGDADD